MHSLWTIELDIGCNISPHPPVVQVVQPGNKMIIKKNFRASNATHIRTCSQLGPHSVFILFKKQLSKRVDKRAGKVVTLQFQGSCSLC